jgi:NADPH:quinone reductase
MSQISIPETMHAVRFHSQGSPDVLRYETVPRPRPGPGQVLARIEAIGVNFGDTIRRRGAKYPTPVPLPYTLGGEAVGEIVAVGSGVDPSVIGARRFLFPGDGCYADYAVVPSNRLYPLPEGLDAASSIALFVQGLTAAMLLRQAGRLCGGESVLVQGAAGGVGVFAVQLAKAWGAGMVIGAASTEAKRDLVRSLGADLVVDYGQPGWQDEVRAATGGRGVDIVLEMTGGPIAEASVSLLAPFGRCVVYGSASELDWRIDPENLPPRNLTVTGFWFRPYLERRALLLDLLAEFGQLLASNKLAIKVDRVLPLSRAAEAHVALEARTTIGKVVLVPDGIATGMR